MGSSWETNPDVVEKRRQKKAGNTKNVVSVWISRGEWFCGALGRKVRTERSSRREGSEQERTTDKLHSATWQDTGKKDQHTRQ